MKTSFEYLTHSLSNMVSIYDNIMVIGDLNMIKNCNNNNLCHLTKLYDVFELPNLISTSNISTTCSKSSNHISIEKIARKMSRHIHKTSTITTGLSDFHKLILTFFKCYLS